MRKALGSGAFGEVYEVFDHNLKQVCALKIHNRMVAGPWTEAQILRQLDGEYILKVLNADLAEGAPYVVTHLATNGTIADQIQPDVGVPITAAVRWARQACQGVARIHDQKLLHRDLKPENLFIDGRHDVLVGDLGLAQLQDENGLADAAGSIPTMAPEIARIGAPGQNPTTARVYSIAADVYSLGQLCFGCSLALSPSRERRHTTTSGGRPNPTSGRWLHMCRKAYATSSTGPSRESRSNATPRRPGSTPHSADGHHLHAFGPA
ncbi:tyrosine kinase family protein [Mycobacterium kansasii 824]|nr:tyrosine kinase family protein [Mycobacterium kansasii 824]